MYSIYNAVTIGSLILILYVLIDFIRNKTKSFISRVIFYSFIFYLLNVVQVTTGGIIFPPQNDSAPVLMQLIPFYFIGDWINIYRNNGFDWFFWNSVKLSFYNLIMLAPFGVYLLLLFKSKRISKSIFTVFLVSLTIESSQFILGYLGFVRSREFDIDDLILNTLGGSIGYLFIALSSRFIQSLQNRHNGKEMNPLR
ncbi:VanZ family protein [Paenibacillus sp. LMG 31460]|uniref:VanZ family protein n=1 Tax=Paenibacillus germinis TaxID=2654979 RepID=A0ABX1Z596_9BACL|nr:VanZ family protein [Paenibacillus germinis]NOU87083.1 VanZ family protein [Paenibacillus germinis]